MFTKFGKGNIALEFAHKRDINHVPPRIVRVALRIEVRVVRIERGVIRVALPGDARDTDDALSKSI